MSYFSVASGDYRKRRLILFQQCTLMQEMHILDAKMVCKKFIATQHFQICQHLLGNNEANTFAVPNALYSSVESKSQPSKPKKGLTKV